MKPALLLVDLQQDFLARPGLSPAPLDVVERARVLLVACRSLGVPVVHVHTRVCADGSDRMPHWAREGRMECVVGTEGARAPEALRPHGSEAVVTKTFFSGFSAPALAEHLAGLGADTLILAGVYTDSCVRATALDAYARGFDVWLARDALGSAHPIQAELTLQHLGGRVLAVLGTTELLGRLAGRRGAPEPRAPRDLDTDLELGAAFIDGAWVAAPAGGPVLEQRDPRATSQLRALVPIAPPELCVRAVATADAARSAWRNLPMSVRAERLLAFAARLEARREELTLLLATEIAKPVLAARDELRRAISHAQIAAGLALEATDRELPGGVGRVRYRPHGVVLAITPWNNPLAISVAKLAPALLLGNTVVWKPSPLAPRSALAMLECLADAGLAPAVQLVFGDAGTAQRLIADPGVHAVSITGSLEAGSAAAARCAEGRKPLQAELGGNNAALVLPGADLAAAAPRLARAAFGFAGQRCTAIRRFVVERSLLEPFLAELATAIDGLVTGDPTDEATDLGPMITREQRDRVEARIQRAQVDGGRVACRGRAPSAGDGAWLAPALLTGLSPKSEVVREETFGPLATVLAADDLDHAIALANAVPHGLLAAVSGGTPAARARIAEELEVGILNLEAGPPAIHGEAPFGGWKASGIGPPEHGRWDLEFFARVQAVYGSA